ncbi:MAG: hypothetical protein HSCHL_0971 [Hydrogenibacillus schlegelii]|uniref:Uncharacterized protein n=1 Tax=Hydrogenibacillus schlegelii TaxID=1484 RepID=A0A2T5G6T5_HYDSH|nr:MAG: hypothetical protein HSCHL_0971 [Hydrogenibacillus schlegelii]
MKEAASAAAFLFFGPGPKTGAPVRRTDGARGESPRGKFRRYNNIMRSPARTPGVAVPGAGSFVFSGTESKKTAEGWG